MTPFRSSLMTATLLVACGGGPSNNPGTGTGTLRVLGEVSASETQSNAESPMQFNTEFAVRVTRSGSAVTDATVVVRSSCGEVTLVLDAMGDGAYRATQQGYCATYTLDVTAGSDRVSGVTVVGPGVHRIVTPMDRQNVDPRQVLSVRWSPGGAQAARVESRDYSATSDDRGAAEIPAGRLRFEPNTATNERVRVTRSSHVSPAGALPESRFTVSVRNAVEIFTTSN